VANKSNTRDHVEEVGRWLRSTLASAVSHVVRSVALALTRFIGRTIICNYAD
jgi:hypothetical protein